MKQAGNEKPGLQPEGQHQRKLYRVMVYATMVSFGGMAAFLFSLRDLREDPALELSFRTVVAFVLGAAIGWLFWKGVEYLQKRDAKRGD